VILERLPQGWIMAKPLAQPIARRYVLGAICEREVLATTLAGPDPIDKDAIAFSSRKAMPNNIPEARQILTLFS